ncbi:hypothetical protein D3C75_1181970 [compost metagenome]
MMVPQHEHIDFKYFRGADICPDCGPDPPADSAGRACIGDAPAIHPPAGQGAADQCDHDEAGLRGTGAGRADQLHRRQRLFCVRGGSGIYQRAASADAGAEAEGDH